MSLDLAGAILGLAATTAAFYWLLGLPLTEQVIEAWQRWRTPVGVCRGCGLPCPADAMHRRDGVPFCSSLCAHDHPTHSPEEYPS